MMNKTHFNWLSLSIALLVALLGASCGESADPEDSDEGKTKGSSSSGKQPNGSPEKAASLVTAQAEAVSFFAAFTNALKASDADRALVLIAESHQYKFGLAYPFWQGCRFFNAKVIEVTGDLMRVQVSFEWPNGKGDREIKKLQRVNGKWRLQDS
jgi:hypothetical protein